MTPLVLILSQPIIAERPCGLGVVAVFFLAAKRAFRGRSVVMAEGEIEVTNDRCSAAHVRLPRRRRTHASRSTRSLATRQRVAFSSENTEIRQACFGVLWKSL